MGDRYAGLMNTDRAVDVSDLSSAGCAAAQPLRQLTVLADGSVRGDDGTGGALAATIPYLGRLAGRVGELTGAGELVAFETAADSRLSVQATWNLTGEGTFRAFVTAVPPRLPAQYAVVGGGDVESALNYCVQRFSSLPDVAWAAVLSGTTSLVAADGCDVAQFDRLAEIGTRVLAVLRAVDDGIRAPWARLDYDGASIVAGGVGRHCLFALARRMEEEALVPLFDEVRAVLSGHDLSAAEPVTARDPRSPAVPAPRASGPAPAPVGARYRGASVGRRQVSGRRRLGGDRPGGTGAEG